MLSCIEFVADETFIANKECKMVAIHPNILERDGQKAFVVLPYEEFLMMEEELEQFEDLRKKKGDRRAFQDGIARSLNQVYESAL